MYEIFRTQFMIFLFSCFLGIVLGLLYDAFRLVRMIINRHNIFIFIQDIIYFLLSAFITFLFVLIFNDGESRFYILAGEGIGWIVYHLTFGEFIYKCSEKIVKVSKLHIHKIVLKSKNVISKIHKMQPSKNAKK